MERIKSRLWNNRNDGAIAERMADTDELFDLSKISVEAACQMIQSSALGLTSEEAAARLQTYGLNLVTREKQPTILGEIWSRSKNPLNALLVSLAFTSYFLGDVRAAVVIVVMVFLSVITAFIQEHRSNELAAQLRAMVRTTASARRGRRPRAYRFSRDTNRNIGPRRCRTPVRRRYDSG